MKRSFKKYDNGGKVKQFTPRVTAEQINRAAGMNVVTPVDQVVPQLESSVNSYKTKDIVTKPKGLNKTKSSPKYKVSTVKTASKPKFPVNLNTTMPSDNTKSNIIVPNNIDRGSFKDDLESMLAVGSLTTPFPLSYGLGLAGSGIDLYDAYNADTPRERNNQLAEAALGAIPYGRIVKGAKAGTDFYKAYKSLRGLNALNKGVDVKDIVDPSMQYAKGGVIKDDRGQWAHPGEITEIGSNNITMQGVNYPVLGVSDLGDTQMMYPEQDYQFKGSKVTEYPMMQKGGKVKPIYVSNPNDPRLKAYRDSLILYNKNKENYEKEAKLFDNSLTFEKLLKENDWNNSNKVYTDSGVEINKVKKPVQPVVYNPITKQTATAEQIKPLYQAPQLTMPERLELSMNKPNVVQSAEGPTFKQGRKFMRETGLRPGFYQKGGKVGEDFAYDRWRRSLPENLQSESPSYNLRGYWESLNKPELFEPFNYDLYGGEFDGPDGEFLYHGFSRNPKTGEILKGKTHPTLNMALNDKDAEGNVYIPYMKDGKIYTDTYADGGTINNMKKRTLKKYQYSYGGLTVTDLNKYGLGGAAGSATKTATTPNLTGAATTGATVSGNAIGAGIGFGAEIIGGLMPDKTYEDSEGNDLGSRKSVGESALEYGAKGAAVTAMLGGADFGIATALGAGYGAYKGLMEKEEMEKKQKEAEARITNRNINRIANTSYNWGTPNINTSTNMMFPDGGMVLNYDDPNANAELELQETFQMPDGTVGNVDGPSHENGGIAVDLPEGTRIWSDKLKHNGKTFAKHTKPITNKIARLEKEIAKNLNNSEAKENSIALLNQQLDYYFDTQETNKQNTEMKRTLREGGMIKRADGSYSKRGLWDNIRANKGSGKKPTAEMLKQERKIRAQEKAMGGYIYAEGGINNPGFKALPEYVQNKIKARMEMGGYMYGQGGTNNPGFRALPEEVQENILNNMGMGGEIYSLGGRLMNDNMFAEGGKLPKDILQSRLEAHMSSEEADAYLDEYGKGGYTVRRSSDRKGKTHVVIGPDGTKKYFGDPKLGERSKSKYGKEAFYARHKKNLAGNPYFRAYARATWEDGGMMGEEYAEGGIHIKPENKGKFTAYAKSHGKGVQEMAAHIMANKEDYSPTIVKRANFAKNAAGWKHEMGGMVKYQGGGRRLNLETPTNNMEQSWLKQDTTPQSVNSFLYPVDSNFDMNQIPEELMYNTPEAPYVTKPFNQLPIGLTRPNTKLNIGEFGANANKYVAPENLTMGDIGESTYKTPGFFNKAGQFIANNFSAIGQLAPGLISAGVQSNRINKLARPRTLADVRLKENIANPYLVDYSAERNAIDRAALTAMEQAQRGFGSSAAAQAFKNKARLNQLEATGRSFQGQENANAQLRNQFLAARQEAAIREAMMNNEIDKYNLENIYGFDKMKTEGLNDITQYLGDVGSDYFNKQAAVDNRMKQLEMLAKSNYKGANRKTLDDLYNSGYMTAEKYKELTGVDPEPKRNGGMIQYAEGGKVSPYKRSLNKVVGFNTSKAAETMDAEYSDALAAGKDKYTSTITGLDYKVIKTLPKNEKRALVTDMWRDAHGEAPTQKQVESGVKAIEGKKVTSPKAKTMAEIVSSRWKTGTATPEQMIAQMTPQEQDFNWNQFGKEQLAQGIDAVGSLGMTAIGNPLKSMFGTDLGFGYTDMSPEAVDAKISNIDEYANAASNALLGIMGGKALGMAANKIMPKFYKPAAKYYSAEARNLELQKAKKVYKANQANRNQRAKTKYYEQVPEPDISRYVRNIANQEDEAFALEFGKRQNAITNKKIESKLNIAEGADRPRKPRTLKKKK